MRFLLMVAGIVIPIVVVAGFGAVLGVLLWSLGDPQLPFTGRDSLDWQGMTLVMALVGFMLQATYWRLGKKCCQSDRVWGVFALANPLSWALGLLIAQIMLPSGLPAEFGGSLKWVFVLMWPGVLLQAWLGARTCKGIGATTLAGAYLVLVLGLWAMRAREAFVL
jgi:hypothetical protein